MLFISGFIHAWPLCLSFILFFAGVSAVAWWMPWGKWRCSVSSGYTFIILSILWVITMGVCLTFADSPRLELSRETIDCLFMFSTFLGIPMTIPLLTGAIWALSRGVQNERTPLSELALVMLAGFGLGCAASNIHDIAWCGVITHWYTQPFEAGYDLDVFAAVGKWFGIPEKVLYDYATLGPCAAVLVVGELLVSVVCFTRLWRDTRTL